METNNVIDVSEASFNDQIIEESENRLVIVDFWAPWCQPCKQLTPLLEKVVAKNKDKILLAKVNIDENQQVAAQLRIQSIPAVFAFKNKQIVDAFQGVIPENKIIEFVEKSLGEKLEEDFTEFFLEIEKKIGEENFQEAKDALLEFIANKPKQIKAIALYVVALVGLKDFDEAEEFISSLDDELKKDQIIQSSIQRLEISKKNIDGPNIEDLLNKIKLKPNDVNIVCELADKYFAENKYEQCFDLMLSAYPKNKETIKSKIIEFFQVLGNSHKATIEYRKKLSQIMFS
tara:strand:- start:1713 stop:2576 length:864 start_codon:yes stop_codon:yes gene_type:complete